MAGRRAYHSPLRQERALQTRMLVLEAAADCFAAHGWAGATMARIAAVAGVSVDTVTTLGPKSFLLLESYRRRYAGEGGWSSILELKRVRDIFAIDDPATAVAATGDFLVAAHSGSARLWLVVRATALTEPAVAAGLDELVRLKEESFVVTTRWLQRVGLVRAVPDHDLHELVAELNLVMSAETYLQLVGHHQVEFCDQLVQVVVAELNLVMSAETYLQLVEDYGFTHEQYAAWVRRTLLAFA